MVGQNQLCCRTEDAKLCHATQVCNYPGVRQDELQSGEQCALSLQSFAAASSVNALLDRIATLKMKVARSGNFANEAGQMHIVQDLQKL